MLLQCQARGLDSRTAKRTSASDRSKATCAYATKGAVRDVHVLTADKYDAGPPDGASQQGSFGAAGHAGAQAQPGPQQQPGRRLVPLSHSAAGVHLSVCMLMLMQSMPWPRVKTCRSGCNTAHPHIVLRSVLRCCSSRQHVRRSCWDTCGIAAERLPPGLQGLQGLTA